MFGWLEAEELFEDPHDTTQAGIIQQIVPIPAIAPKIFNPLCFLFMFLVLFNFIRLTSFKRHKKIMLISIKLIISKILTVCLPIAFLENYLKITNKNQFD
ncbi:hypothetical protein J6P68_05105 [bacterium]|nr:hypothetical protein [bacterium]